MNFQSIFFVLSIFAQFTFGYSKISTGGKLSPEENQKRLDTCGREGLPNPPNPSKPPTWFWVSYQTLPNKETIFTSASQISSRHLLTFHSNLLSEDMKWIHNKSTFNVNCSVKANLNVEVPTDIVKRLKLTTLNCYRGKKCNSPELTPVRAFLPCYCTPDIQEISSIAYSPMIVEVHEEIPAVPVCLDEQSSTIHKGDTVESYRLYANKQSEQSKLNVTYTKAQYTLIGTTLIPSTRDFSGPIVKLFADKWTIVGYTSIYGISENSQHQVFYRMSWFQDAICSLTGICDGETTKATMPVPTIPPIKLTTVEPTTVKPATVTTTPTTTTTVKPATTQTPKALTTVTSTTTSTKPPLVPITTVKATTVTTTTTTVKPATTKPSGTLTTVTGMKTSKKLPPAPNTFPPIETTVATATVARTTATTVPTTVKTANTKPLGPFTTVTSTTSSTKPLPVSKTVTTVEVTTDSDSMAVPTILPKNSTDDVTPDSSTNPSAPTNQTTHPEDPPPDDPVTYEPPLALGIDFSLGPEHSIDEPPIDYEEYEERKKHMDDDDQDYKDFWMDETGNGGEKRMRLELLLIFGIRFIRL